MLADTDKQKAKGLAKYVGHPYEVCKTRSPSWRGEQFSGFLQGINRLTGVISLLPLSRKADTY